jgi:phosphonate transport system permease protein
MNDARVRIVPGIGPGGVAFAAAAVVLVVASFVSLHVTLAPLFAPGTASLALDFVQGFAPPALQPAFLRKLGIATLETIAMSAVGTLLAAIFGLLLSLPAAMHGGAAESIARRLARPLLAVLRAIPELVWAALFVIVAGLGPFSGTMALALHTTGVLGRLFAETIENLPSAPADTLRAAGVGRSTVFAYATLPQALPQFLSYALYRWENNIRAAAILGVVGAGGLGQMLMFHLSLFQMQRVATIVIAIVALVAVVDGLSALLRRSLTR